MRFSYIDTMNDLSFLKPVAQAAEEAGYHGFVVPDSICYPQESNSRYPYTADGSREFLEDEPLLEPVKICPVPREPLPRLIGGHSKPGLRRAVTLSDGWMHWSRSSAPYAARSLRSTDRVEMIRGHLEACRMLSLRVLAEVPAKETDPLYARYGENYDWRSRASDLYYLWLGTRPGRETLLLHFTPCNASDEARSAAPMELPPILTAARR